MEWRGKMDIHRALRIREWELDQTYLVDSLKALSNIQKQSGKTGIWRIKKLKRATVNG